ncbi:MAG: hypothetical protein GWP19_05665 [Planctomycetia bacterium]|nr:hypothetical protein [Planctomycetia bacterium]
MKTIFEKITIKSVSYLLIVMMSIFIINNVLFIHAHKMDDSRIVVHAHPYDKSDDSQPYKSHHHTKTEFLFLRNLGFLFLFIFLLFIFLNLVKKLWFSFLNIDSFTQTYKFLFTSRAPPII